MNKDDTSGRQVKSQKRNPKKRVIDASFALYIRTVMKQVHPDAAITSNATEQLNSIINYVGGDIGKLARRLANAKKAVIATQREIFSAVKLYLPGELAMHGISEGTKAVVKFNNVQGNASGSHAERAGIVFAPARVARLLKVTGGKFGKDGYIFLAAVLEYLAAEILELAGNLAREDKRHRVTIRDIQLTIHSDHELASMVHSHRIKLQGGGVLQDIHPSVEYKKIIQNAEDGTVKKVKRSGYTRKDGVIRYKPGVAALKGIKNAQKQSECFVIPRLPFDRLVRHISKEFFKDDLSFSEAAMKAIHLNAEQYLVGLLYDSNLVAINANRTTVKPKDVQTVRRIRSDRV
jgi:histone H3/H4